MQRNFLLHCCFLFLLSAVHAQVPPNCLVRQYGTENGLPSNGIKGLQFDEKNGFLWLATEAGIVRFNGVDFTTYSSENLKGIESERIMFLTRSFRDRIFISDMNGNIFSIEQSQPRLWWQAKQILNPYYDNYYLLSVSDSFFTNQLNNRNSNKLSAITATTAALSDTSCLILSSNSLYYYSFNSKKPEAFAFQPGPVKSLFKIGKDCFLIDMQNQAYLINPVTLVLKPVSYHNEGVQLFSPSKNARTFWEMGMDAPVIIEGTNAWLLSFRDHELLTTLKFSGVPVDAFIRSVKYSEKNQMLFLGTDSRGLIVLSQPRVHPKKRRTDATIKRNSYYSQIELTDGNILTNEGDIIGNAPVDFARAPFKGGFSLNLAYMGDSLLWFNKQSDSSGRTCLHSYHLKTGQTRFFEKVREGDLVANIGTEVYLANPNGIGLLSGDSMKILYKRKDSTGLLIFDFKELEPGKLFLASCDGLLRFDPKTSTLDTLFQKRNTCVRNVWKYKDYLFFGTYGDGFYISKNGRIRSMPLDKNKFLLYTHCFIPDEKGFCWISTNRGLFKASLTDLINAYERNVSKIYYHYIGKNDGMDITEMNGGCTPCALMMKNKQISFPTMDGLLWVDALNANFLLPEGNIYVDEFRAGNALIYPDFSKELRLTSGQRDILLKLGYSAWSNKENIYLEYKLDNGDWIPVDLQKGAIINFNNLLPGNYTLMIRKMNGFGIDNYSHREIKFSINKPWNRQWWFYLLMIAIAWALLSAYLRFRTRQYKIRQRNLELQVEEKTRELRDQNEILEKNNSIKSRLISIISHDIITPLKFLTVAGKNLIEKKKMMPDELQEETIREMTNTSQELQFLSTNILNWIKYQNENRLMARENFNVHDLVNQVLSLLSSLAKQKNLVLENKVNPDLSIYQYYEPLKILVYNLLTNAIHFTETGKITVSATEEKTNFKVIVKDEGVGMTPEQIQRLMADQVVITAANVDNKKGHGLGYLIIKDLVKTMEASIQIESKKGRGTKVSIVIPAQVK